MNVFGISAEGVFWVQDGKKSGGRALELWRCHAWRWGYSWQPERQPLLAMVRISPGSGVLPTTGRESGTYGTVLHFSNIEDAPVGAASDTSCRIDHDIARLSRTLARRSSGPPKRLLSGRNP